MCKMITRFMTKISFINVSELMLEMLELALVMLFFMSFAKISSDVADKGEFKKLVSYGMPAAMLAAVIGVSRLVITLCGKETACRPSSDFRNRSGICVFCDCIHTPSDEARQTGVRGQCAE